MFVFFVKQKTAYEMRISDWSSDVCSSDLTTAFFYRNPVTNSLFTSVPLTQTPGGPRFTFRTIFPGGFAPDFHATIRDASLVSGLRGSLAGDLTYDVSSSYGQNNVSYSISNTVNPSLGDRKSTRLNSSH